MVLYNGGTANIAVFTFCITTFMATHQKTPLLLHKNDVVLVKPSEPTPSDALSFSTIDNAPDLELICHTIYVYQSNGSNHYLPDPASILKQALSRVLVYYYPLAGKLKRLDDGKLQITCSSDGVPFLEATANCNLSSLHYLDGVDVETAKSFAFDWPTESSDGYHPLVLQVTKFACGGFTIGMGLSHSVCDGFGAAQFFRAMTELASGKTEPSVKPVWGRERLVGTASPDPPQLPLDKASLATSPFLPTTNIQHEVFNVDGESIRRLKMNLERETENERFTTIETLGAYVCRSKFRALEQNPDGKTVFTLAIGIRNLINPPMPDGYYGNAFVSSHIVLMGRDLDEGPLCKVVKLIKEGKKTAANNNYIWSSLNLLETVRQQNLKIEFSGESMVLTDWRQLGLLEETDFGWKATVNMIPLPWNTHCMDLCIFLPPCRMDSSMKGGVRICVTLPRAAMVRFKEEMDALKLEDDNALI